MSLFLLLKYCATTVMVACLADLLITRAIQNSFFLSRFAAEFQENEWSRSAIWRWLGLLVGRNTMDFMSSRALFFPVMELIFPLAVVTSLYLYGFGLLMVPNVVFSIFIILVFVINLRTTLVPHIISLPGIVLGILLGMTRGWQGLVSSLLGALVSFSVFIFLYELGVLINRLRIRRLGFDDGQEAMGGGVVLAATLSGAFCGYPSAITAMIVSMLVGGVVSLLIVAARVLRGTYVRTAMNEFVNYADIMVLGGAIVAFILPFFPDLIK